MFLIIAEIKTHADVGDPKHRNSSHTVFTPGDPGNIKQYNVLAAQVPNTRTLQK